MKEYKIVAPCHFGMEAVLKREIQNLGYEITEVSDGRVIYSGDAKAVVDGNIYLRTAERILVLVGSFRATTFEELFQGIRALPWEEYIPEDVFKYIAENIVSNVRELEGALNKIRVYSRLSNDTINVEISS